MSKDIKKEEGTKKRRKEKVSKQAKKEGRWLVEFVHVELRKWSNGKQKGEKSRGERNRGELKWKMGWLCSGTAAAWNDPEPLHLEMDC